jgi:two-component system chemotaxis sensor kinase CheA
MSTPLPQELQQQLIHDFLIESTEGLDNFDRQLLALEKGTTGADTMNIIFRVIHTIKGTAGCIGLGRIETTAHVGESLLSLLRDGKLTADSEMISALLALSDALRGMLHTIEASGHEGTTDHTALLARLVDLQTAPVAGAPAPVEAAPAPAATEAFGLFGATAVPFPAAAVAAPPSAPPAPVAPVAPVAPAPAPESTAPRASVSDSAIRVDVAQLDKLMNLVGELVLARNQIIQNVAQPDPSALLAASQRLNLITTELQGSVMKTRMQPIGNVWSKFPRIVRDLAHELGKEIQLVMEGQETELDRTIIEAIKDPLTHIVRNAVDHGLELPAARRTAGKPAEGRLVLRAFHEGGQVNIEFIDDGAGINVARVRAKAVERGLVSADQAARLTDREVHNLIFLPGFSTAEKVTNLSGRGVGMDVVKTNIEKIGGSVDVQSTAGRGTTLKIKIPLTLAIIPALVVTSGGERFAIPQVSLLELVRLEGDDRAKIETLYNAAVYRLRGRLLPLVDLNRHLGLTSRTDGEAVSIVVLQADGRQFGLVVDAINDAEEIVVKPLGKQLKGLASFAGATIMGDGRVALILDVLGVAQLAHVITGARERAVADEAAATTARADGETLLLFETSRGRPMALPLSQVSRLEELAVADIEFSGRQEVIQYRGQIMPLLRINRQLEDAAITPDTEEKLQVVVYSDAGRCVGLVVSRISDIVSQELTIQAGASRVGIRGSAVIQQRVTDLLDVPALVRAADLAVASPRP